MSQDSKWKTLEGGLNIAVASYDRANPEHRKNALELLAASAKKVAAKHGAAFSEAGFRNVMRYLDNGAIKAEFYEAAWDVCKPKNLGGAFFYNAIGMDKEGKPRYARYTEDVALLSDRIREIVREMPSNAALPSALAENFEKLSLEQLRNDRTYGVAPQFRYGEFDSANTNITRALEKTGAVLGSASNSGVLQVDEIPDPKISMVVSKTDLYLNDQYDPHNFVLSWREKPSWLITSFAEEQDNGVDLIVTQGFATTKGSSVAQMRPVRVGAIPEREVLDNVFASMMKRAEQEIREVRFWGVPPAGNIAANDGDAIAALIEACAYEVMGREKGQSLVFGGPMVESHIHILNDKAFLDSFRRIGAEDRVFGTRPMMPATNFLQYEEALRPANNENTPKPALVA